MLCRLPAPIPPVFSSIPDVLAAIADVFAPVANILETIAAATDVTAIPNIFETVPPIFASVADVLTPVANVFKTVWRKPRPMPRAARPLCRNRGRPRHQNRECRGHSKSSHGVPLLQALLEIGPRGPKEVTLGVHGGTSPPHSHDS